MIRSNVKWYDAPKYYDIAFSEDTELEADFIEAACQKYCNFQVKKLLEPACGSGRLIHELAARGYRLTGFDLSEPAIQFAAQRLARRGLKAKLFQGEMSDFTLPKPVDAAFNLYNTFRHLLTEDGARRHLECVAASLRPGGIYVLGLHLLPLDVDQESLERWSVERGQTRVTVTLRVVSFDRKRRVEKLRVSMLVRKGAKEQRLRDEFFFRLYTARQFRALLSSVPQFELADVYDFCFDIREPLRLDDEITDSVFILRKRASC